MRIAGAIAGLAIAALVLSHGAIAQPLPREFSFGGSGGDGGYTATVEGTATIDPAAKTVSIHGTVAVEDPEGTVIVQQDFGHTATWNARASFPMVIELNPLEGLSITITVMPGEPAEVVVQADLP